MYHQPVPEGKDPQLWHLARRRISFRRHLSVYLIINIFLWALWYFTGREYYVREYYGKDFYYSNIPWPLWTTLGWGIGLAFHFMSAYVSTGSHSIEKEYNKLENKNKL